MFNISFITICVALPRGVYVFINRRLNINSIRVQFIHEHTMHTKKIVSIYLNIDIDRLRSLPGKP